MLTVLIVDDDEEVRSKAMRALADPGIQLASAANGRLALEQAARLRPDVVICDIDMPEVNGFDVLAALKADEELAGAQVMMLTSLSSRNSMRLGMSLGADDYLTKPFTDQEIREAFQGLLRRRGRMEVLKDAAARKGEASLPPRAETNILVPEESSGPQRLVADAVVLFADIRGFTSIAEKLSSQQVATLLSEYFERACEPVLAQGGQYLKLMGDGLMAVFVPQPDRPDSPARRALVAATEMAGLTPHFAGWIGTTFPEAGLPAFRVGFGLHSGEVAITQMGSAGRKAPTPIGDVVNIASRLEGASKELDWEIVASEAVTQGLGDAVRTGATATITVRGRVAPIAVLEVLGIDSVPHVVLPSRLYAQTVQLDRSELQPALDPVATVRMRLGDEVAGRLRIEARAHADLAARAMKGALADKLAALRRGGIAEGEPAASLQGYTILRRLGTGGMASVYLARNDASQDLVVLKVMALDAQAGEPGSRLMREFTLLSSIRHPHVVRIYNQGFSDAFAYLAMEYFENGDLRSHMKGAFAPAEALRMVAQVASALGAIHARGIVHRDLKPENLMVRANGDLVVADFGIAKALAGQHASQATLTLTGELLGSPSYMSPEQIAGAEVTGSSDFYSLGVLLYELAAGERPFHGATIIELLSQHLRSRLPPLPGAAAALTPLIERLMAKRPVDRHASAAELLADIAVVARGL